MSDLSIPISLAVVIFGAITFFYVSVGLGGGSSYTAMLAVLEASTQIIPTISLSLNILVTNVGQLFFFTTAMGV